MRAEGGKREREKEEKVYINTFKTKVGIGSCGFISRYKLSNGQSISNHEHLE